MQSMTNSAALTTTTTTRWVDAQGMTGYFPADLATSSEAQYVADRRGRGETVSLYSGTDYGGRRVIEDHARAGHPIVLMEITDAIDEQPIRQA